MNQFLVVTLLLAKGNIWIYKQKKDWQTNKFKKEIKLTNAFSNISLETVSESHNAFLVLWSILISNREFFWTYFDRIPFAVSSNFESSTDKKFFTST